MRSHRGLSSPSKDVYFDAGQRELFADFHGFRLLRADDLSSRFRFLLLVVF
jgi:hypothetical protein